MSSLAGKAQRKIWVLAYFLASAAALIPAPLIEFRYYTIPFFLLVLHSPTNDAGSWLLMGIVYLTVTNTGEYSIPCIHTQLDAM